jgi:hypothetical protein
MMWLFVIGRGEWGVSIVGVEMAGQNYFGNWWSDLFSKLFWPVISYSDTKLGVAGFWWVLFSNSCGRKELVIGQGGFFVLFYGFFFFFGFFVLVLLLAGVWFNSEGIYNDGKLFLEVGCVSGMIC